jgi:hypothetical protein
MALFEAGQFLCNPLSGRCSIHINGVGSSLARITPAAITSAELVIEPPGLLGSSEQITTGASCTSSGR